MATKVGINGFGRIGRMVFRATLENRKLDVVAVNDITDAATLAHLLKYDSTHGRFSKKVSSRGSTLSVGGKKLKARRISWNRQKKVNRNHMFNRRGL